MPEWLKNLYTTIDKMDANAFADYISRDGEFIFGNIPAVVGRENISTFVDHFFKSIKGIQHTPLDFVIENNKVISWGIVTYTRHNETQLSVKFCNLFLRDGELIKTYDVYVDTSQLYQ